MLADSKYCLTLLSLNNTNEAHRLDNFGLFLCPTDKGGGALRGVKNSSLVSRFSSVNATALFCGYNEQGTTMKTPLVIIALVFLFSCEQKDYMRCYECTTEALNAQPKTMATFVACSEAEDYKQTLESSDYVNGVEYRTSCEEIKHGIMMWLLPSQKGIVIFKPNGRTAPRAKNMCFIIE